MNGSIQRQRRKSGRIVHFADLGIFCFRMSVVLPVTYMPEGAGVNSCSGGTLWIRCGGRITDNEAGLPGHHLLPSEQMYENFRGEGCIAPCLPLLFVVGYVRKTSGCFGQRRWA